MKKRFSCPPSFDIRASSVLKISKDFQHAHVKALCDDLEAIALQDSERPEYYSTAGRLWKLALFPYDVVFEEVKLEDDRNGAIKHFHTGFKLASQNVHIDFIKYFA